MFGNIDEKFNTTIFNPPYVISKEKKHIALDGGKNGRDLIERFLSSYKKHLMPEHSVLLLRALLINMKKRSRNLAQRW